MVIFEGILLYGAYQVKVVLYNLAANLRRGFVTIADIGAYAIETSLYVEKICSLTKILIPKNINTQNI